MPLPIVAGGGENQKPSPARGADASLLERAVVLGDLSEDDPIVSQILVVGYYDQIEGVAHGQLADADAFGLRGVPGRRSKRTEVCM